MRRARARAPALPPALPTRRSSDLLEAALVGREQLYLVAPRGTLDGTSPVVLADLADRPWVDRKSTRLNSSHVAISYAVFCLKQEDTLNGGTGGDSPQRHGSAAASS